MRNSAIGHAVLTGFLVVSAWPAAAAESTPDEYTITFDGEARKSYVYEPPSYQSSTSVPLIIVFHGGGGNGALVSGYATGPAGDNPSKRWNEIADNTGAIIVYPNGQVSPTNTNTAKRYWNVCASGRDNEVQGDDAGFIEALIGSLKAEYPKINLSRVYAMGHSNGGAMARTLLHYNVGARIAAIAINSSNIPTVAEGEAGQGTPMFGTCRPPLNARTVVVAAGTADPLDPDSGGVNGSGSWKLSTASSISFWRTLLGTTSSGTYSSPGNPVGLTPDGTDKRRDGCPTNLASCSNTMTGGYRDVTNSFIEGYRYSGGVPYSYGPSYNATVQYYEISFGGHTIADTEIPYNNSWNPTAADFTTANGYNYQHLPTTQDNSAGAQNRDFNMVGLFWDTVRYFSLGETSPRWERVDIGTAIRGNSYVTNPAGSYVGAGVSGGIWTVAGAGNALGGATGSTTSDSGHFVYEQVTGDFTITAKIAGFGSATSAPGGGVAVRESYDQQARTMMAQYEVGSGRVRHWGRRANYGPTFQDGLLTTTAPVWVRIQRQGEYLGQFHSLDGTNWTPATPTSDGYTISGGKVLYPDLEETLLVGFWATSYSAATANDMTLTNVGITYP